MSIMVETVKTAAFSMDYFKFGQGENVMVILPGLSVQSVMGLADAVADAYGSFADAFTVYLFDRRKELPAVYPVRAMAEDTAAAFQALGLRDVFLFGASQGGMMAMEIALRHPELVRKLALGSTASRVEDARFGNIQTWIRLAAEGDPAGLYLAFGEAIYPASVFEQSRALLLDAAKTATEEDLRRFIILAEGLKDFDVTEELWKIGCPVLVTGAGDDRVLGGDAAVLIREKLPDRPENLLRMFDGYGHAAYDLAPDYKAELRSFFLA